MLQYLNIFQTSMTVVRTTEVNSSNIGKDRPHFSLGRLNWSTMNHCCARHRPTVELPCKFYGDWFGSGLVPSHRYRSLLNIHFRVIVKLAHTSISQACNIVAPTLASVFINMSQWFGMYHSYGYW